MKCSCKDWDENIDKINAPLLLAAARSGGKIKYEGKKFVFCPWCAKELKDDNTVSLIPA